MIILKDRGFAVHVEPRFHFLARLCHALVHEPQYTHFDLGSPDFK